MEIAFLAGFVIGASLIAFAVLIVVLIVILADTDD